MCDTKSDANQTLVPALLILTAGVDPTTALVLSQVVLSFGIPLALIPLAVLTARRSVMGFAVNHPVTTALAVVVVDAVVALNLHFLRNSDRQGVDHEERCSDLGR